MAELVEAIQKNFISLSSVDVRTIFNPAQRIDYKDGGNDTLRGFFLNLTVSDTDDQRIIMHVDSLPPQEGNGIRITFDSTMVTVVNERLKTIMQELVQQLTEASFQQITATTQKGRGSYAPHMNPSRRQPQNYKKNLQKLQSFAKRTRSQAMVTASSTPPLKAPKQKYLIVLYT